MSVHCNDLVKPRAVFLVVAFTFFVWATASAQIPETARQVIIGVAPEWISHRGSLQCYQRDGANSPWKQAFKKDWPALFGRNGLAWGRGPFSPPAAGPHKTEKDGRAPAGVFAIGDLYGYASTPPDGATWPYLKVGPYDAWIDDPKLPHYNQHVRVDSQQVPSWFESQKMRLGDKAYRWMLEIKHNANPPTPGHGSAIFFHVRRGEDRPTAGCTTMAVENLEDLIRWLKPAANPHYVLLPLSEYDRLRHEWKLP